MTLDELEAALSAPTPPYARTLQPPTNAVVVDAVPRLLAVVRAAQQHVQARKADDLETARQAYAAMSRALEEFKVG